MMKAGVLAALTAVALALAGVPEHLGAHPSWAVKVGYLGAGAGAVAVALLGFLGFRTRMLGVTGILALIVSAAVVAEGKARFVTSYGDDVVAGRMWFWGWIAVAGAAFVVVFVGLRLVLGRRD